MRPIFAIVDYKGVPQGLLFEDKEEAVRTANAINDNLKQYDMKGQVWRVKEFNLKEGRHD